MARSRAIASRLATALVAVAALATSLLAANLSTAGAAGTVTYTNTQTIPVPPASSYGGAGGGDGWSVAFSATEVFNVFHHQGTLQVACHEQSDASQCYSPVTVQDAGGHNFGSSGHPGMYFDPATKDLLVYATRDDGTAGVVCFDTQAATTAPFCGFTALTAVGDGYFPGMSNLSDTMVLGQKFYAFNYYPGVGVTADQNRLLCFDVSTGAACASQPYDVGFDPETFGPYYFPEPQVAVIGGKLLVANPTSDDTEVGCFDPTTAAQCAGSWPVDVPLDYASNYGAPYPKLSSTGALQGFCLPDGTDPCWTMAGLHTATPAGMPTAIPGSDGWNGQAVVLGPRVYLANGNYDEVFCYDASTDAACGNFPKSFDNLGYIYTTTLDPQRPSCIWVNADNGSEQIQNFDAYTGGACGEGPIRVLASSFVVNAPQCVPGSYTTLKIDAPDPSTYSSGTVQFLDGDGNPLPYADRPVDASGNVDLTGLDLSSPTGLPQFLITLNGTSGDPTAVTVTLTWQGTYDSSCTGNGTTVVGGRPVVTDLSPRSGPAAGGTTVVITGTDFSQADRVVFGGVRVTSFTIDSDTQITVTSPPHAAGRVKVRVHSPLGLSARNAASRYHYTRR